MWDAGERSEKERRERARAREVIPGHGTFFCALRSCHMSRSAVAARRRESERARERLCQPLPPPLTRAENTLERF